MEKSKTNPKIKTIVMLSNRKDFFARGKAVAKALDEDESLIQQKIISFEDTEDLVSFLTK